MASLLGTAILDLKAVLVQTANSGQLGTAAADAFGFLSVPESIWELQDAWGSNLFSDLPEILLVPGSSVTSARAFYVAENDKIYVNEDWISNASRSDILAVLVEEVGHHLDFRFNTADSPGDEGELFSRVMLGNLPNAIERSRISSDNDVIQVELSNGQIVNAETADLLDPIVRLTGTTNSDQLAGGTNGDALFGLAGNDELLGGAGNDYLDGGSGFDVMDGGFGDDVFVVDNALDVVVESSNGGKDSILSSVSISLPDYIENLDLRTNVEATGAGNELDNVIYGGFGSSRLIGAGGKDSLYGRGSSDDFLDGGSGDDYLDGGLGIDLMEGGVGNDTYVVRDSQDIVLEGVDAGIDWVYSTNSYSLSSNIENLQLFGAFDGLSVSGNNLNNTIVGDKWANSLYGGAGNDYINGGIGADLMVGGVGDDTFVVDNEGDLVSEDPGHGTDWVVSTVNQRLAVNVENLELRGVNNLVAHGNDVGNIIKGNFGDSTIFGGDGGDSLYGRGEGRDRLFGEDGNDYLDGGLGDDYLEGGTGNDTFVVDSIGDQVAESEDSGSDWVVSDLSYSLGSHLEGLRLRGTSGSEDLDGFGNELDNTILGNSGRNSISGGAGNDILNGGAGVDSLSGGAGRDIFVMASREIDGSIAIDKINDFETGQDILYLSRSALQLDTAKYSAGVIKSSDFAFVTNATEGGLNGANGFGSSAAFVFDQSMGILYHNSNGSEQGTGSLEAGFIQVDGSELKASDILLA